MSKSRLKKHSKKRSSFKSKLIWLFIVIALFLVGSVYAAFSSGSGPLAGLFQPASLNRIIVEDPSFAKTATQRKAINELNNAANQEARAVTPEQKARAEARLDKATKDFADSQITSNATNPELSAADRFRKTNEQSNATNPEPSPSVQQNNQTPSKPESCAGGNGVKLTPGKYAATGYGWTGTDRDTNPGAKQRECVYIDENCNHGPAVACDVPYKNDPTSVILPVNAGKEYYAGTSTNVPDPKANCYDGVGVIHVTGDASGEDRCFNGAFLPETEFDAVMGATCDQDTQKYNLASNKCETKSAPPVGDIQQEPAIDQAKAKQQCEAANNKDTNKANDKAYNSQNGTCNLVSAPVPTCKAGWNSTNTGYTECEGGKIHYLVCDKNTSSIVNGSCVSNAHPNTGNTTYSSLTSRTVASCDLCNTTIGEVCKQGPNGSTCINEKLITPIWNLHVPEQGEAGSFVKDPSLCEVASQPAAGFPGQYQCLSNSQKESIAKTNEAIINFFIKTPGEPGSVVKDPETCTIGSVKSAAFAGQYQCLSETGLAQQVKVNNFLQNTWNKLVKTPGEPGSVVKDPETCTIGSVKSAAFAGQYQCLSEAQKATNEKVNKAIINFFIKTPGEPGSVVKDPETCTIGSVKSAAFAGQYQCLSEAGYEQQQKYDNFFNKVVNYIFKEPGEPGTIVKDPTLCKIGSVRSVTSVGQYQCLSEAQKATNEKVNAQIENILSTPKIRPVDSCDKCVDGEGCVLNLGSTPYQCVSTQRTINEFNTTPTP